MTTDAALKHLQSLLPKARGLIACRGTCTTEERAELLWLLHGALEDAERSGQEKNPLLTQARAALSRLEAVAA